MGEFGQLSRILAGKFGSPFTYSTFHAERTMAPGQMSYQQMKETYRYEKINHATEVYGVIADPISHSLSPHIHNAAFDTLGLNKVYVPIRVRPEDLTQFMHDCRELGIRGLSVTIPHKEEILNHATKCDAESGGNRRGQHAGLGWRRSDRLQHRLSRRAGRPRTKSLAAAKRDAQTMSGKEALVLGAGGVARAIVVALLRARCRHHDRLANAGTGRRAGQTLQGQSGRLETSDTTSNATSSSTARPWACTPTSTKRPSKPKYLKPDMVVFDTVYNPEQTLSAQTRPARLGCRVITGVDMFIGQAAPSIQTVHGEGCADGRDAESVSEGD